MRRLLGVASTGLGVLVAAVALLFQVGPVQAHGELADARPAPGASVGGPVVEVELMFIDDLSLEGAAVTVFDPDDRPVVVGPLTLPVPSLVRAPMPAQQEPGIYRVAYSVTSIDGFVFEGGYLFTLDSSSPPVEPFAFGRTDVGGLAVVFGGVVLLVLVVGGGLMWLGRRRRHDPADPGDVEAGEH